MKLYSLARNIETWAKHCIT